MAATHGNQVETARTLIAAGADINLHDKRLDNPCLEERLAKTPVINLISG